MKTTATFLDGTPVPEETPEERAYLDALRECYQDYCRKNGAEGGTPSMWFQAGFSAAWALRK
jgi:hypothetical protein